MRKFSLLWVPAFFYFHAGAQRTISKTTADTSRLQRDTLPTTTPGPKPKILQDVLVTGNAAGGYRVRDASAGPLGKLSIKDIPYSINVTSGELVENRNVHTLSDALKTNPAVSLLMESNTYSSLSRVMIRGFTAADQNEFRDGLVDRSFTLPPVENIERIEVQNGLSGFLYGFSEVGGTINYVSKQPTPTPLAVFSVGRYGGGINYAQADLGGPLDSSGRLGYRVNVYRENGGTYIKSGTQGRTLISGVFDYRLFGNTHLKADISQQTYNVQGLQSYFALSTTNPTVPAAFDPTRQYGQPWTYNESEKTLMGLSIESRLNETCSFRAAWRYGTMWRKYSYVDVTLPDSTGTYSETYWDSPRQYEDTHSSYALADATVVTGKLRHHFTFGYTGTSYLYQRGADIHSTLGVSNIDAPVSWSIPSFATVLTTWQIQSMTNFLAADRIELNRAWTALLGLNYASLVQKAGGAASTISTSSFTQHKPTPGFGLIFKPTNLFSAYGSFTQGLTAGGIAPAAAANANQQLPPDIGDQEEVGVKATVGVMDITSALFRINQVNEYTDPADNVYKAAGREVHTGIELTASGKITPRLSLVGGGTLLHARVTKAANNPSIEGKIPLNVPEQQGRIYLEYLIPGIQGLIITGGINYNGRRPATSTDAAFLPGTTTEDAGLRYQPQLLRNHATIFSINVSNLTNKKTWVNYRNGDGLELGAPRIVSLNAKVKP